MTFLQRLNEGANYLGWFVIIVMGLWTVYLCWVGFQKAALEHAFRSLEVDKMPDEDLYRIQIAIMATLTKRKEKSDRTKSN